MKSAIAVAFDYRASFALAACAVAIMGLASVAVLTCALPLTLSIAGAMVPWLAGALALWRFRHPSLRRIAYGESGWVAVTSGDDEEPVLLRGHTRCGPLQRLDFVRGDGRRLRIVLTPDNADTDTRRRLRLILERAEIVQI
ncbi:MAG: hypothetical protein WBW61_06670 [Rhodanobacteraceae bacterium]